MNSKLSVENNGYVLQTQDLQRLPATWGLRHSGHMNFRTRLGLAVLAFGVIFSQTGGVAVSAVAPKVPSRLILLAVDKTQSAQLSFPYMLGASNGSEISRVEYSTDSGNTWLTSSQSPIVLTGLVNGRSYAISARAVNAVGNGSIATKSAIAVGAVNVITFIQPTAMKVNDPDQVLSANSAGGETRIFSTTPTVCRVILNKVRALAKGTCRLTAANPGNSEFKIARNVNKSLIISNSTPTASGVQGPLTFANIRLIAPLVDFSNSMVQDGTAADWVKQGWYGSGLKFISHEVAIGTTLTLTYHATDQAGLPLVKRVVRLAVNKQYSSSNASFLVPATGAVISPVALGLNGGLLSGTTDLNGNVSFTITNTNTVSQAGNYTDKFENFSSDSRIFSQIMPSILGQPYEAVDIIDFQFHKPIPTNAPRPNCAIGYLWCAEFNETASTFSASANNASQWEPGVGNGCPRLCGIAGGDYISYQAENNALDGLGNLVLTAKRAGASSYTCSSGSACTWTSGKLLTKDRVSFKYGKIEARIKVPAGSGAFPAFWMLGQDIDKNPWPGTGELDIMEASGGNPKVLWMTAHLPGSVCVPYCDGLNHAQKPDLNTITHTESLANNFHTYGIEWQPDYIRWTFDGVKKVEVRKSDLSCTDCWEFNKEMFLILNLSMNPNFSGPIESSLQTTSMKVDWIRYSKYNGYGSVTMR